MNHRIVKTVMDYLRTDGPNDAPICFLTIEDGQGFKIDDLKTEQDFLRLFTQDDGNWNPAIRKQLHEDKDLRDQIGHLGIKVCKIMSELKYGRLDKYRKYAFGYLYRKNEMNVKFFPISRRAMNDTGKEVQNIEGYMGMPMWEYESLCRLIRPDFFRSNNVIFNPEKFFIITSLHAEWLEVLKSVFSGKMDYMKTKIVNISKNKTATLYYDNKEKVRFAYFNLFARGISDDAIRKFCKILRNECPQVTSRISDL